MKKVLFLPFLQISSGHHQVADALAEYIRALVPSIEINKIDILQYTFGKGERLVSRTYLKSIKYLPAVYSKIYKNNAYKAAKGKKRYLLYEAMFYASLKRLVCEEKPDLIVCTHCLPSYLLNIMKKKEALKVPVINAYTDFFINTVWGIDQVDLHFVPSKKLKNELVSLRVNENKIMVTGIPVHPKITKRLKEYKTKDKYNLLISGGNLGVGSIDTLFQNQFPHDKINYYVLCGKNKPLYHKLASLNQPNIIPLEYVSCRHRMNELYDNADLMLTKPGGVTISECLFKGVPVVLLEALPGQEELNQVFLSENNLVLPNIKYSSFKELEQKLLSFLEDQQAFQEQIKFISHYQKELDDISKVMTSFLAKKQA